MGMVSRFLEREGGGCVGDCFAGLGRWGVGEGGWRGGGFMRSGLLGERD